MKNSTTRPGKNTPLFFYTQDYDMFIMRTMKVALSYHEENPHLTVGEIHEELISDIYRFLLLHVNELTEFFNKHGVSKGT